MLFHTLATFSACFWADLCAVGDGRLKLTTALRENRLSSLLLDFSYWGFIFVGFKKQSVILTVFTDIVKSAEALLRFRRQTHVVKSAPQQCCFQTENGKYLQQRLRSYNLRDPSLYWSCKATSYLCKPWIYLCYFSYHLHGEAQRAVIDNFRKRNTQQFGWQKMTLFEEGLRPTIHPQGPIASRLGWWENVLAFHIDMSTVDTRTQLTWWLVWRDVIFW